MNKKKLKPNIRFKGFDDMWSNKRIADVGSIAMCKRVFKHQTKAKGEVPFFKIGTFGGKPDAYIDKELYYELKSKYNFPYIGAILLSASGTIGKIVEYEGKDEYFQDSNIIWVEHDNSVCDKYLKHYFSIINWYGLEGSTIKRLYNSNILNSTIKHPNLTEQKLIGSFFETTDKLLKKSKEKVEEWKNIRTSLLSKMFPKEGEKVPEIRFKGFSGEWELQRLGEIVDFLNGHELSWKDIDKKGRYECLLYGNLYTDYGMIIYDNIKYRTNRLLTSPVYSCKCDVLVPSSSTTLTGVAQATSIEKDGVLLGGGINILRPHGTVNGSYLSLLMNCYKKEMLKLVKGITIGHIYNNDIKNIVLPIAQDIEEQEKIVNLFIIIDKQIKKYEEKKVMFEKIKSTFLNKMFV